MFITSPKDVLAAVSKDLKSRRLTQQEIAKKTGYKSRQAISLILRSDKYLTDSQAKVFCREFGYYEGFLTRGEGSLMSDQPDPLMMTNETKTVYPEMVFALPPFEDKDSFEIAFNRLLDGVIREYGEENIRRFILLCGRYIEFYIAPSERDIERRAWKLKDPEASEQYLKERRAYYNSQEHKEFVKRMLSNTMDNLYMRYLLMQDRHII